MIKIDDWFSDNIYVIFRRYCQKNNYTCLEDLINFNFDNLLNEGGIGKEKVSIIKKRFLSFFGSNIEVIEKKVYKLPIEILKTKPITIENLQLLPLFSSNRMSKITIDDLHETYSVNHLLKNLLLKERTENILKKTKLSTIGELLFSRPAELKENKNCGNLTIKDLQNSLTEFLLNQNLDYSINWYNFESMISSTIKLKSRDLEILKLRLGIDLNKYQTLESVGNKFNLTRERVRQILSNISKKLSKKDIESKLESFWIAIELVLEQNIGLISSIELSNEVNILLQWEKAIESHSIFQFIKMFDKFFLEKDFELIGLKRNKCNCCERIFPFIRQLSKTKDKMQYSKTAEFIKSECCAKSCLESIEEKDISLDFIKYIIHTNNTEQNQIIYDDDYIYNSEYWEKLNCSLSDKIANILLKSDTPKHITDILELVDSLLNEKVKIHNISSLLARNEKVILWDRGTYIHKNNISVSNDFLDEISNYGITKLNTGLPFLCISGIYDKYKKECLRQGIPSYTALYSLLRNFEFNEIILPYYPTIFLKESYSRRIPIPAFVENFLLENKKPMLYTDFKRYFQKEIGIKSYSLQQICANSNVIIKEHNNLITHINYSTSPISKSVLQISITKASDTTNFFKSVLFESKEITEIENKKDKYYLFTSEKGKILIPTIFSHTDTTTLKYKLYEKTLNIKYDIDPMNPGTSLISWESQLIVEPDWKQVSDDILYAEFSFGKVIICLNLCTDNLDIFKKITNNTLDRKPEIDLTFIENLQVTEKQEKVVSFLINSSNSVSHLKLMLFCRQQKIQFPQILNSINEKSNQLYNKDLIISKERKFFYNEKFLK